MGSIFLNAGLVAGVSLAALPVILHLFMRQTPKHVIFPALRLIKERQKRSRKRLRVKNWLLLLARMGLLALMALALARPRIDAKASLGTGDEPTAVALVFDTSLSMGYKVNDRTRLDEAKDRARDIVKTLNGQSKVFILDGADPAQPIAQAPASALKKIDSLEIRAVNRTLNAAMGAAYTAVGAVDLPRREVYAFTDLAASQWQTGQEVEGLDEARKAAKGGEISTFVLRVGAKEVRDVAIVSAEATAPVATADDPLILKVKLRNIGPKASRIVQFRLDGVARDKKIMELPANGEVDVPPIVTPKLSAGLHRLEVDLAGEPDPLKFDDSRFLTVNVRPAIKILVVSETASDGDFVTNALDPRQRVAGMPRPFHVTDVRTPRFESRAVGPLKDYEAIFLLNVRELGPSAWSALFTYLREGGGVVLAPAGYADVGNYNKDMAAAEFLPATLGAVKDHRGMDPPFGFGTPDLSSPLFAENQKDLLAELGRVPIYKTREVSPHPKSRTLLRYTDNSPALLERIVPGQEPGKVLLWTTSLSTRALEDDPQNWTAFPKPNAGGLAFLILMDQTAYFLSGASGESLVFEAGQDAMLPLDPSRRLTSFKIQGPSPRVGEGQAEAAGSMLLIASPSEIGHWSVTASGKDRPGARTEMGFSVNPPRAEIQATPLEGGDLDTLFGKGKYQIADDAESLKRVVSEAVYGREIFPYIMALILLLVTLENLLANTFYRAEAPRLAPQA